MTRKKPIDPIEIKKAIKTGELKFEIQFTTYDKKVRVFCVGENGDTVMVLETDAYMQKDNGDSVCSICGKQK